MFDARNNLSNQVVADVRRHGLEGLRHRSSPQRAHLGGAVHGKPVLVYHLKCVGSEAYLKLATRSSSARRHCGRRGDMRTANGKPRMSEQGRDRLVPNVPARVAVRYSPLIEANDFRDDRPAG